MTQRKSNFELLRIISIFLIVVFHSAFKSGFSFAPGFSANKLVVKTFWMFGELGVDLFMLITGYFMITGKFHWKKLALLAAEVQFYHWGTLLVRVLLEGYRIAYKRELFLELFPLLRNLYWFITAYVILYMASPFLNIFLHAMDRQTYRRFLALVLLLYSVVPTAFGLFYGGTEGLLFYNRLIWLLIVYCIGAYIRLYSCPLVSTLKRGGVMSAAAFAFLVLSILFIDRFSGFFARLGTQEIAYFWSPNTVPMVILSVGMLGIFMHLDIGSVPWLNRLASTTLGIYLLHDGRLCGGLWSGLDLAAYQDSPFLVLHILAAAILIVSVGACIDLVRQWLERHTLRPLLDRLWPDVQQGEG